jgi:hypothetical protein
MIEGYGKKRNMAKKYDNIPIELTTLTFNDVESKDRRQLHGRDVEINTDSLRTGDRVYMIITQKEQAVVAMEDSDKPLDDSMTKNRRIIEVLSEGPKLTTISTVNENRDSFRSIAGYAEEPLLPLSKACAPLVNILPNLYFYVQMALNETPEVPPDGLTIDESAAIRLYTIEWFEPHQSLYSMLNHTLKDDREHLHPYYKYMKLFLTALVKLPCVPPSIVWRGVNTNMSADFPPDTHVTLWPVSSCTSRLLALENNTYLSSTGSRTLFSIETINGRKIRAHSHYVTEDEILLLPGTHMIVQSQLSPAPDLHIIHLKQVIPNEMLLALPFEGTVNITNHLF